MQNDMPEVLQLQTMIDEVKNGKQLTQHRTIKMMTLMLRVMDEFNNQLTDNHESARSAQSSASAALYVANLGR